MCECRRGEEGKGVTGVIQLYHSHYAGLFSLTVSVCLSVCLSVGCVRLRSVRGRPCSFTKGASIWPVDTSALTLELH